MKITVPRQDPLSLPQGKQQRAKHVCREYSIMKRSVAEVLECPREKQQLRRSRLGFGSSADCCFPPDDARVSSFISNGALFSKARLNSIGAPLHRNHMTSERDQPIQQLAQVTSTSFRGLSQDHTESVQDHTTPVDADMEKLIDCRYMDPSLSEEEHCISECQSPEVASEVVSMARMKVMCSFGGRIMARPVDGKLRYVGGETRIVSVCKGVSFAEFISKMSQIYGSPLGIKYQLPDEDLDALISVSSDDDLQNMMEECDKSGPSGVAGSRIRLFFFSISADVEFAESNLEGDISSSSTDQRYVDAINGLPANPQANHQEDGTAVLQPTDGGGRVSSLEQINEKAQCSALSPTLSSGQANFCKPSGLLDLSLQNVNESPSKATVAPAPFRFEGEIDGDVFGNSTNTPFRYHYDRSQVDFQLSQAMDSPRIFLPDGAISRNNQNLLDLHHVDSQSKLARLFDHHNEFKSSTGLPLEHCHEASYGHDMTSPQEDYDRTGQQHALSLPSPKQSHYPHPQRIHHQHQHQHYQSHHQRTPQPQQQYHHNQEQHQHYHGQHQHQLNQHQHSWYPHSEGDAGRGDYFHKELHTQSQHHQLIHHQLVHDGCSWNTEHHASPRSTHPSTQMFHGLASAPPYHMGSTPLLPQVGVYEHQGTFPCGLHHSQQVHRGITVSIGEPTYNRRPPFQSDQGAQKQFVQSSSRFYDNGTYGIETAARQQVNHSMLTGEVEREEFTNHWPLSPGRHLRDVQSTTCLTKNRDVHYTEPLAHNGEKLTVNTQCMCGNCIDNRIQQMELAKGHFTHKEAPDHALDWSLHQKLFDLDGGRIYIGQKAFPRAPALKDEEQNNFNERISEVEYGECTPKLPGNSGSPVPLAAHIDSSRELQLSSGAIKGSFVVSNDPGLALVPRSAELSSYLSKNSSKTAISRSMQPLEPVDYHDALSCQPGKQMPSGKDLQAEVVLESLSGATKVESFDKNLVHSEANNCATMSISFCGDKAFGGAGRVESDAGQYLSPKHVLYSKDQGGTGALTAGQGDSQLLSPEVIRLGSMVEKVIPGQKTSSVFDQSPFSSADLSKFSFAAGRPLVPLPDKVLDEGSFVLDMSVTGEWTDSMSSLVLHCSSDETLAFEMSDIDQDASYSPKEEENVTKAKGTKMVSVKGSIGKLQLGEVCGGSLGIMKGKTLEDGMEPVINKAGPANGFLEVHAIEESEATLVALSCQSSMTSHHQEEAANSERNKPSVSEAEAIAHGLQIIKNSDLEDMKELGSGTYGTVYHGKWRGSDVAIKRIKASCFTGPSSVQGRLIADFWREACTLGKLHHPNVVAFYGVVPDGPDGTLARVTEYMVNGSLKQVLHKKDRTIDRRKRLFLAMDAAFGMEYLHSKNIVHFDLKCENLLVNMRDSHRPICKVSDFGLSKVKHHTLVSGGVRGTLPWMAPELLSGNCGMVSEKVDVYSFGIVMWELLTGEEPYSNMHCGAIIGGIANNTLRPSIPSWCDPGWRNLMERCWCGNPAERPPFAEVAKELRAIAATMNLK